MAKLIPTSKVLFARVGWTEFYACCGNKLEQPLKGGSYNENEPGAEQRNFQDCDGQLFGYVRPPGKRVDVGRLGGEVGSHADNILVLFVARVPKTMERELGVGQRLIGWYRDATVFDKFKTHKDVRHHRGNALLNLKAPTSLATLLPVLQRTCPVPRCPPKGGMGQANIRYMSERETTSTEWMTRCIDFALSYEGENLLNCLKSIKY